MEYIALWLLFAVFSAVIASAKNKSAVGWFLIGLFFGPFGLVVGLLPSSAEQEPASADLPGLAEGHGTEAPLAVSPDTGQKTVHSSRLTDCPDCGGKVSTAAASCPHCGRPTDLPDQRSPSPVPTPTQTESGVSAETPPQPRNGSSAVIPIAIGLMIVLFGAVLSQQRTERNKSAAPDTRSNQTEEEERSVEARRRANIRRGPSTTHEIARKISSNEKLLFVSKENGWYQLQTDPSTPEEWIHESVVTENPTNSDILRARGNVGHAWLLKQTDEARGEMLAGVLEGSGKPCTPVKTFFQGIDKENQAYWNIRCDSMNEYAIGLPQDPAKSTRILECEMLKLVGSECWVSMAR
jgi:hypothetical protein